MSDASVLHVNTLITVSEVKVWLFSALAQHYLLAVDDEA